MKNASEHYETSKLFLTEYENKLAFLEKAKEDLIEKEINYDSVFSEVMNDLDKSGKPKTALKDLAKMDQKVIDSKKIHLKSKMNVEMIEEHCKILDKKFLLEKEAMRSATAISNYLPE